MARRVLSQQRRAAGRRKRLTQKLSGVVGPESQPPESVVVRNSEYDEVEAALYRLRPTDREVLRLAVWEELPHAEIATILGCSAHAVDQRLYRATMKLARELSGSGHKGPDRVIRVPGTGEEAP